MPGCAHRARMCLRGTDDTIPNVIRIPIIAESMQPQHFTLLMLPNMSVSALRKKAAERLGVDAVRVHLYSGNKDLGCDEDVSIFDAGVQDNRPLCLEVESLPLQLLLFAAIGHVKGGGVMCTFTDRSEDENAEWKETFSKLMRATKSKLHKDQKIRLQVSKDSDSCLCAFRDARGDRVYAAVVSKCDLPEGMVFKFLEELQIRTEELLKGVGKEKEVEEGAFVQLRPLVESLLRRHDEAFAARLQGLKGDTFKVKANATNTPIERFED